jgi:hypothetical protein
MKFVIIVKIKLKKLNICMDLYSTFSFAHIAKKKIKEISLHNEHLKIIVRLLI